MGDGAACPDQAAEQLGRSAFAQPGHHGSGVGDRGECRRTADATELRPPRRVRRARREHAQPGRSRSSARHCGSLLPARTRGRCSPAQEFRRTDRRPAFPARCCRSAAEPPRSLRTRRGGGGHARSSRCRPARRAIPPGRGGCARTGSRAGEGGSGNSGRSGCPRRPAGRAWFPRRPSKSPSRPGSSCSRRQGWMLSRAWRSCASGRSARTAAAEPGSTRRRPGRHRCSRRLCAAGRRPSTVRAGRVAQNWQRALPSGIRAAARRIRPHPLHSVTTCSSLS